MKTTYGLAALLLAATLAGCSTEQAYNSVKGWQRNECNKRIDNREREQCLKDADQRYDDYQKERRSSNGAVDVSVFVSSQATST